MKITFDRSKSDANVASRQLSFERAEDMDFDTATYLIDDRKDYGEVRHIAVGYIDDRLHILCFTMREEKLRVISLRRANEKEARRYGKTKNR